MSYILASGFRQVGKVNSVIINDQYFTVEYVDNLMIEGEVCEGGCWLSKRVIRLSTDLLNCSERHDRVLRHEIYHALIGLSGLTELMPDNVEEALCVMLESASYLLNMEQRDAE